MIYIIQERDTKKVLEISTSEKRALEVAFSNKYEYDLLIVAFDVNTDVLRFSTIVTQEQRSRKTANESTQ